MILPEELTRRAKNISLVCFDVDGVLTDGKITYTSDGQEIKSFNVLDGSAIKQLQSQDVTVAIITGRQSNMVERRAKELGIQHCFQGVADKQASFNQLIAELNLAPSQCAHVGDDLADVGLFEIVGLAISVPNGHAGAKTKAHYVTATLGGQGVASEVCELLFRARDLWNFS